MNWKIILLRWLAKKQPLDVSNTLTYFEEERYKGTCSDWIDKTGFSGKVPDSYTDRGTDDRADTFQIVADNLNDSLAPLVGFCIKVLLAVFVVSLLIVGIFKLSAILSADIKEAAETLTSMFVSVENMLSAACKPTLFFLSVCGFFKVRHYYNLTK